MTQKFDVVVIGGGPGGYVAAIRASQLGLSTALIEEKHLGGVCLNWGCIPTKALLKAAEIKTIIDHAKDFGIEVQDVKIDIKKMVARSRDVSGKLSSGIGHLMKKNKIKIFEGRGRLKGKGLIHITMPKGDEVIEAKHTIIATGARPRALPHIPFDKNRVWSSSEAMVPDALPKSLLIIGSGAIGIEFASFYSQLGVGVTVVEIQERILPVEDAEISALARAAFEKQGIKIHTSASVEKVEIKGTQALATLKIKDKTDILTVDGVIVAVGIDANTQDLGLENTKVKVEKGHIVTNEWMETDEKGVYALGDVAGPPWLAHKASHEAIVCLNKIKGESNAHPLKKSDIPGCTYSNPQIASVGLTEAAALAAGFKINVGRFPFMGNGKALAIGHTEGLVKTIFDQKTGELLGAHLIGADVTELIQGFCIAKTLESTEQELMDTIFPHPTLSEMMHESVLSSAGKALHI